MNTPAPLEVNKRLLSQLPNTQAARVFARFGGVGALYRALKQVGFEAARTRSTLYRWNLPRRQGGSDGIIPTSAWPDIMKAARLEGVHLTPEDCMPDVRRA